MRDFISFLAPQLRDYLELKKRLGFTTFGRNYLAGNLDRYAAFRQIDSFAQLNEDFLMQWVHARNHRSARTKNHMLSFARRFFDYLMRHGYLSDNPTRRFFPFKKKPFKPYIYTLDELRQILEAARKRPAHCLSPFLSRTLETVIFLLYACGLRLNEALTLRIKDVNFPDHTLSLWNTKFHKERLIPFSPAVAQVLRDYLAERMKLYRPRTTEAPFFCHAKGKYGGNRIDECFRQIRKSLGLAKPDGGPRLHDMRHSFAVHRLYKWYQEGHDIQNKLPYLSTYMGHYSIVETQVYLRITTTLLREANRRFQASFEDLAKKPIDRIFKNLN